MGSWAIHFRKELCECQNTKQVREQDKQIFIIIIVLQVTANLFLQSKNACTGGILIYEHQSQVQL